MRVLLRRIGKVLTQEVRSGGRWNRNVSRQFMSLDPLNGSRFGLPYQPRDRKTIEGVFRNEERIMMLPSYARVYSSSASHEIVVPSMGESVNDGSIATILKNPGDFVKTDEIIAQIETDKVTIDVRSSMSGVIEKIQVKEGDTVTPGTVVALISESTAEAKAEVKTEAPAEKSTIPEKVEPKTEAIERKAEKKPSPPPPPPFSPAVEKAKLEMQMIPKSRERRVPMTRLRKRVATRLKDAQNTFAMLTTFNEVDMSSMMTMRSQFKDAFFEKHKVKFGFMSGFVKAAVSALKAVPTVNGVIDGDDIIYRDYYDISIAVGTPKGLVVPVIRDAGTLSFADIEKTIAQLAGKAVNGTISIDDMAGGTFTISNGGVYGSLISTPIINPPQSAILGMHSIQQRPVVVNGQIVAKPMMYVALTYDHRLIDGREAVLFLRHIKDVVEDPRRLLLDL